MNILAINVGSSSLKAALFDGVRSRWRGRVSGIGGTNVRMESDDRMRELPAGADHDAAFTALVDHLPVACEAIGHRLVHGSRAPRHRWIDDELLADLASRTGQEPLHLPNTLAVARRALERFAVPQAFIDDSAFFRDLPPAASTLPLPADWRSLGLRRQGYHGLACAEVLRQLGSELRGRCVVLHLGAGCSATAIRDGRSCDTSMTTPSGGLVMASRSGDLDPAVLLRLLDAGLSSAEITDGCNRDAGLRGLSGISGDMQELLARREDPAVDLALEIFCRAAAKTVAGMAVSLGGLDQLVFTGGIGEHAPWIRARICVELAWMGLHLDPAGNETGGSSIAAADSPIDLRVLRIDEERAIAIAVVELSSAKS